MEKFSWLGILNNLIKVFDYIYIGGILYNDLKVNNVVVEKIEKGWNFFIIDYSEVRFV